MTKKNKPCWFV